MPTGVTPNFLKFPSCAVNTTIRFGLAGMVIFSPVSVVYVRVLAACCLLLALYSLSARMPLTAVPADWPARSFFHLRNHL
ncbi:hypothetical protein [Bacillus safensis]|uniref:hypothetical protein n=1 Tax=Bacillus safensis TaxID=561879 RepID=UPI001CEFE709|nr:hypothetical protein [Bacillus safensis]MCA6608446.1 hypothetical protein [Bacillus safensis]